MEQWTIAALGAWAVWAEIRALLMERRHGAERRDLCARLQAGTIERYDAHTARVSACVSRHSEERPRTPAAPVTPPVTESVADAKLQFDRLMGG